MQNLAPYNTRVFKKSDNSYELRLASVCTGGKLCMPEY